MARSYWLISSNSSRIKKFIENTNNKVQFLNICLLILKRLRLNGAKNKQSVMTKSEALKKDAARGRMEEINC